MFPSLISHKHFDDSCTPLLFHSHLLIISIEMPQFGQLALLMAVITPCFQSMSLIHLTVCFPQCCSPSILIKPELNDQRWLSAGAHPSQHVAEERDLRCLLFMCSRPQTCRSMLSSQCSPLFEAEVNIYGFKSPFYWFIWYTASNVQHTSGRYFIEEAYWRKCEEWVYEQKPQKSLL